ncbi:MAG TPA: class I SAM-dependent methyltransferase [Rhizomicrobium sp.]|nr:class I SAM-dependent methyltransferase [Rhizomicrobium sp.]
MKRLPFMDQLRKVKRQIAGYEPDGSNIASTLADADKINRMLRECGVSFSEASVLEIGTGWFPMFPLIIRLSGASTIYLTDLEQYMDEATFDTAKNIILSQFEVVRNKFDLIDDAREVLLNLHMSDFSYIVPFSHEEVPDDSLDMIISRAVLEHIPREHLESLLRALRPKLKGTGLMAHAIDNSDHYEHRDKSISRINFLTWSQRKYQLLNWLSGSTGENRLRHHEYKFIFERSGYQTVLMDSEICARTLDIVSNLQLAEPYRDMSHEELCALSSYYVIQPALK